jgi:Ca2+-binding RTX toxin-like protein
MAYEKTIDGIHFGFDAVSNRVFIDASDLSGSLPTNGEYYFLSRNSVINYIQSEAALVTIFQDYLNNLNNGYFDGPSVSVSGTAFDDIINTDGGYYLVNSSVDAGAGDDKVILGGPGFVNGGTGNDIIYGSTSYKDTLIGGEGNDTIFGYGGGADDIDKIEGGDGDDTLAVFSNSISSFNLITNQNGSISGGLGADKIYGAGGVDYLFGNEGNDKIYASAGNDVLNGGEGDDFLVGDSGWDVMTGGAGADVFGITNDVIIGGYDLAQREYITDFEIGIDHILIDSTLAADFSALDARTSFYNDGNWGIIEFNNGQIVALWQVDMSRAVADWFQFGFVPSTFSWSLA